METIDQAVLAGGILLMLVSYGLILARGAQQLVLTDDELHAGERRIAWDRIQAVQLVHGPEHTRLVVQLEPHPLEVTPRMTDLELPRLTDELIRRAGLEPGEPVGGEAGPGERVKRWVRPTPAPEEGALFGPEGERLEPGTVAYRAAASRAARLAAVHETLDRQAAGAPEARTPAQRALAARGLGPGAEHAATPEQDEPPARGRGRRNAETAPGHADRDGQKKSRFGALAGPIGVVAFLLLKFGKYALVAVKFGAKALKLGKLGPTAVSMLVTVWIYAQLWGWRFGLGFVVILFIHEIGHAWVISAKGIRTSPIMFVPFLGAFITLKDQLRDAAVEAEMALGGPVLGSLAATACFGLYLATGSGLWLGLAYTGFLLNLFNLLPVSPLDGGRIVSAISAWLWLPGLGLAAYLAISWGHPILIIVALLGCLRAFELLKALYKQEDQAYFEVPGHVRVAMAVGYFGLAGYLAWMMQVSLGLMEHAAV